MSDDTPDDQTQPVRPEGATALPPAPAATPAPAPASPPADSTGRRGFRERLRSLRRDGGGDRTFGLAALIASALAGIIVGGLGVSALHAIGDDHRHDRGELTGQRGPVGRGQGQDGDDDGAGLGRRGPLFGGPGGGSDQVQPTTPPEDDGSSVS